MDPITLIVIIVVALVVVAVGVWMYMQKRRTEQVRERFGPEYDRAVTEHGDQRGAQADLEARQTRVEPDAYPVLCSVR
jgi:flagellar basal body-associated protein FliL